MEETVKRFMYEQFPLAKQREIRIEDEILESGVVDSLGVLDIVNFVESEFSVTILDEDLGPENFGSIEAIVRFVQSKQGQQA